MEYLQPSKKAHVLASLAIAGWVILLALVQHFLEVSLHVAGGWTFTAVIMFFGFMPDTPHRLRDTLGGAAFGLIVGMAIFLSAPFFAPLVGTSWCSSIPVSVAIFLIIVGHNVFPMCCNNTAFGYMILSTMQSREVLLSQFPIYLLLLLGMGFIAIQVTVWIQTEVFERLAKQEQRV